MNTYEALRIATDKALLAGGRCLYKVSGGKMAKIMFSQQVRTTNVGSDVKILAEDEDSVTIAKVDKNGNIKNNGFRILSSTDFHFGDDPALRFKCMDMFMKHIKATRPDLVVLTGDIIQSKFQHFDCIQFGQFMEEIGVYWAFVFGNHEAREEKGRFKHLLMTCQTHFPHCLARQGKEELFGYGNYCINIMKSENEILKTLFMFDSGRDVIPEYVKSHGAPEDIINYDFIKNNQMDWYKNKITALKEQYGDVKSFMYMHIPLKEYENAIIPEKDENGLFPFTGKCEIIYGNAYETVGSSQFNSGMFSLIKELGSTEAVFSGHDHVNDFCALYDGVYLVYNQTGGYETYTLDEKCDCDEKDWPQGVTITDIEPDGTFDISRRFSSMYL
ncbi:MAG: metallophosphoesterase [Clostridia bacterium]|nr:metallophosphoesterase [Clostridia bacterium]